MPRTVTTTQNAIVQACNAAGAVDPPTYTNFVITYRATVSSIYTP